MTSTGVLNQEPCSSLLVKLPIAWLPSISSRMNAKTGMSCHQSVSCVHQSYAAQGSRLEATDGILGMHVNAAACGAKLSQLAFVLPMFVVWPCALATTSHLSPTRPTPCNTLRIPSLVPIAVASFTRSRLCNIRPPKWSPQHGLPNSARRS